MALLTNCRRLLTGSELTVSATAIRVGEAEPALIHAGICTYAVVAGEIITTRFRSRAGVPGRVATVVAACSNCVFRTERHDDGYDKGELGTVR